MSFSKIPRRAVTTYHGEFWDILKSALRFKFERGGDVAEFERKFAETIGAPCAVAAGSGHQAMVFILQALGLKPGDGVIVPAYTLKELPGIIAGCGWTPEFADIDPETFHATPETIERARTERTRAVIATHIFGSACDIDAISEYCKTRGLLLVEDCAQALGVKYKNIHVGNFGDASFFSFSTDKAICTFGGGMAVAADARIASEIRARAEQLPTPAKKTLAAIAVAAAESVVTRTFLFSLLFAAAGPAGRAIAVYEKTKDTTRAAETGFCDLQAVAGLKQLGTFEQRQAVRRNLAESIIEAVGTGAGWQKIPDCVSPAFYQLVLKLPSGVTAGAVAAALLKRGVDAGSGSHILHFCPPDKIRFPNAFDVYEHALQIPCHERLSPKQIRKITHEMLSCASE